MKQILKPLVILAVLCLTACATISSAPQITCSPSHWGIVPFSNNTEVPQAGYRAMSITKGLLEARGVSNIRVYKSNESCNQLIVCPNANPSINEILAWARRHDLKYVMTGTVNEWVYKVGLDGEPVVSLSLNLYDVAQGRSIWSTVGSRIGTTRSGLGTTGQNLIRKMLCTLKIAR
ncbi:MAG: penicillin-binding protein activator LpoB [Gammaproteobacteria bacterium]|nr:penicillin-binding protein activator LpoB [Gammaproteobacteria bacterium]